MKKQPDKGKITALYERLSHDDERAGESVSIENQKRILEDYAQKNGFTNIRHFTDEGISGTNTKKRDGFNRMIEDAVNGKIDLILTKSVSRFARNTVDSLVTIRQLKEKGVEVYFEKENIYTFDGKGELLLTIMSSLAQEESRSISENVTWGQRKRFADGKVSVAYSRFLGYDKGPDGRMVINPAEAETVKKIYRLFLEGMTPYGISRQLEADGDLSPSHKPK